MITPLRGRSQQGRRSISGHDGVDHESDVDGVRPTPAPSISSSAIALVETATTTTAATTTAAVAAAATRTTADVNLELVDGSGDTHQ